MEKQVYTMSANNSKALIDLLQIMVVQGLNNQTVINIIDPAKELLILKFKNELKELRNAIAVDNEKCLDLAMGRIVFENDDLSPECNKLLCYLCRDVDSGYIPTLRSGATTLLCSHA